LYKHKEKVLEESNQRIKTTILDILPKYIVRNKTKSVIIIGQVCAPKSKISLMANEESPFFWHLKDGEKNLQVSYPESLASEPFNPSETGTIVQELIRAKDRKTAGIIRIERVKHKGVYYIEIYCEFSDPHPYYILHNDCANVTIGYKQTGIECKQKYLDANSVIPFGWSNPNSDHEVTLKFLWGKAREYPIEFIDLKKSFSFDDVKPDEQVVIQLTKKDGKYIWVSLEYDGYSRILKISDTKRNYLTESNIIHKQTLEFSGIGLSLVSMQDWKRIELLYAIFTNIQLRTTKISGKSELYFAIGKFQIDNQSKHTPYFPVVLHKTREEHPLNIEGATYEEIPFFQLGFCMNELSNPLSKFYSFDFVKINTAPISIKLEEEFLLLIYDFFNFSMSNLQTVLNSTSSNISINNVKQINAEILPDQRITRIKTNIANLLQPHEDLIGKNRATLVPTVHINEFTIQKLMMTFWFKPDGSYTHRKQSTALKAIAAAFLNVEALPIVLNKIAVRGIHYKITELLLGVAEVYKENLEKQTISIMASLLFAPIRDIEYLGTGIVDMMKRESDTGEKSSGFMKNAILGTFGTASRLAATASKGILALSSDEDYITKIQKEEEKLKPKHILEGVGLGAYSALRSIASAIYGVVSKPVEGAMQDGVGGLMKGAVKGLTGAIVKPISGGLDFISKTSEGVKNTAFMFDGPKTNPNIVERVRKPRVFYTSSSLIQQYDENHAKLLPVLRKLNNGKYFTNNFLDIGTEDGKELGIVLITEEHIVHFVNEEVKWEIDTKVIVLVELEQAGIVLHLSDGKNVGEVRLTFASRETAKNIYDKLNNAVINDS